MIGLDAERLRHPLAIFADAFRLVLGADAAVERRVNALRHTAASSALALGKPIETLIFEHGHAEGVTTLKAHYIGKMTRKEAVAISSIGPGGTKLPTIVAA